MKHYGTRKISLYGAILMLCLLLPLMVWQHGGDSRLVIISAVFSALFLLSSYLVCKNTEHYLRQTVIALSDLLASITSLQAKPVFSSSEDTLLSKLQTQVTQLTGILQAQKRAASLEKNEIKSLISDISHQLKTPVTALKMYGELLQDTSITDAERQEYTATLMLSLKKLEFLMDSMIKMSRLESHIIQVKPEHACFNETVLEAVMQCHIAAKEKQIRITFDEADSQLTFFHDKRWTAEAIFNVLDNAVKYTPAGGKIRIALQKYTMFCRLDIMDTGVGIPEAEQEKVFQRFYRGSRTGDSDGLGIGLYLSRCIIADQGGYIKLKSGEIGSMFSIFLPL